MSYGDYPDLSNVKKVLVIKLRQLGDVLLTTPVFSALSAALPGAKLDAYVYSESIPLLEDHPDIDACIGYDRKWKKLGFFSKLLSEWRILRHIRRQRYDLVINLTEGDRGAIAAKASGAKIRVGFDSEKSGFRGKDKFFTHLAKICPTLRHSVERNLDALRRIGIFPSLEQRELSLPIPVEVIEKMRAIACDGFILIHPTSRWKFKCWPVDKMRELAISLTAQGHKLVFTSGPDSEERAMVAQISKDLGCINLSGQITLKELSALISLSDLLICVDSLPLHHGEIHMRKLCLRTYLADPAIKMVVGAVKSAIA
jgi:heptosyltransferase-3